MNLLFYRFGELQFPPGAAVDPTPENCHAILSDIGVEGYVVGTSRVRVPHTSLT